MSDVNKTVVISKEVDDVVGAAVDLIIAAKRGQLDVISQLSKLISLLGDFAALPAEIRDNLGDSLDAVMLQVSRLVSELAGIKND